MSAGECNDALAVVPTRPPAELEPPGEIVALPGKDSDAPTVTLGWPWLRLWQSRAGSQSVRWVLHIGPGISIERTGGTLIALRSLLVAASERMLEAGHEQLNKRGWDTFGDMLPSITCAAESVCPHCNRSRQISNYQPE